MEQVRAGHRFDLWFDTRDLSLGCVSESKMDLVRLNFQDHVHVCEATLAKHN